MATIPTSLSSFDFAKVVGEAHTVIRVRNLQCTASVGTDAWGRHNAIQPVLISATVVLKEEFESAAQSDQVNNSTVHYGILSKALLRAAQKFTNPPDVGAGSHSLVHFTSWLYTVLLGSRFRNNGIQSPEDVVEPVLDIAFVKAVEITVRLPKASLLGTGVSYTSACADFVVEGKLGTSCMSSRTSLKIHDLDIPTLVGVNAVERLAKQRVITNIEIDSFLFNEDTSDSYGELEQLVVKTIDESSFETLESLAEYLSRRIIYHYIYPSNMGVGQDGSYSERASKSIQSNPRFHEWQKVKISLEKPTAVTFADAPMIEIIRPSAPTTSKTNLDLWTEFGRLRPPKVPFPLQGSIEDWIRKHPS